MTSADRLAGLIEARLAGEAVDVPPELRDEFDRAVAAHDALRGLLDETLDFQPAGARLPPNVAAQYDIERELGHGGMGVVYLARQRSLNRRVALKVLRPGERTIGPLVKRFLDEAQHLAQLRHPNIVSIHEVGEADGEPYFTMDFIDGETLSAVIARGPLTPTRAVEILKQVAAAIQHAHRHGIIHRDLKPGNVLLDQSGQVFVTDFGLARNVSQDSNLTQTGELLGTPQYMSPEQARGQTALIGEATDIHALGLLLFEMLSGRAAFGASSPADVLVRLLHEDPPALRSIDRRIPRDLETICLKALQKSPAARYSNVSALLEDLRRYEAGEPLLARRTSIPTRIARWTARRWKVAATALATAALVMALAPQWFDKSVEELIEWGGEELRDGRPDIAAQIFQRAWSRGDDAQRSQIVPQLTEAIRAMPDSKQAVDAALKVIAFAPETSFGPHDYLVAQAVTMAARAETPNGYFEAAHPGLPQTGLKKRELAARRLTLFLEGSSGTREERTEAERTLQAIDRSLRGLHPTERWSGDDTVRLPEGTPEELAAKSVDPEMPRWERGKAAMALGRIHEAGGDSAAALSAYRSALEQLRQVFPIVTGVSANSGLGAVRETNPVVDAPECRLVREVMESIERIDPELREPASGGVRLSFDQPELLQDMRVAVSLELSDPAITNPRQTSGRNLASYVPMSLHQPREVRVLPGRYRLNLAGTVKSWDSNAGRVASSLIDISAADWPKTIDVGHDMIDLPPLQVRVLKEIKLTSPADLARINLTVDSFTWTSIPGAASYEVTLGYFTDNPHPSSTWFHMLTTSEPSLTPSRLPDRDRQLILMNWPAGRTIGLSVGAFNDRGQRLAVSVEEPRFLIATPLPASP